MRKATKKAATDLFGEIPVTKTEIALWVEAVAGIPPDSWRFPYYAEYWNVAAKVAAAKADGSFEAIISGERVLSRRRQ